MKTGTTRRSGFTLIEIMLVVSIIGMLAAIAIPNLIHARTRAQTTTCISNLRQIDAAKQQWAFEQRKSPSAVPLQIDLDVYLSVSGNANKVACPAGGAGATFGATYDINQVKDSPTCKIVSATHVLN